MIPAAASAARNDSCSRGTFMPSPLPRMTGPSMPSCRTVCSARAARSRAGLVHEGPARRVAGVRGLHHEPGLLGPEPASGLGRVEQRDQLVRVVHPAGCQQGRGEFVRFQPLVHPAQAVADGLPAQPVAAAFVAEQVAPAAGPGFLAAAVPAPRGRAGAGDHGDAGAGAAGGEQQPGVVDHGDPGAGHVRGDQRGERRGVVVGVDAAGSGVDLGDVSPADPGEELRQVARPLPRG